MYAVCSIWTGLCMRSVLFGLDYVCGPFYFRTDSQSPSTNLIRYVLVFPIDPIRYVQLCIMCECSETVLIL